MNFIIKLMFERKITKFISNIDHKLKYNDSS